MTFSKLYSWALGAGGVESLPHYLYLHGANSSGDTAEDLATSDPGPHARANTFSASGENVREHD